MEDALAFVATFLQITELNICQDMLAGRMGDIHEALESLGIAEAISRVYILGLDKKRYSSEGNEKETLADPALR